MGNKKDKQEGKLIQKRQEKFQKLMDEATTLGMDPQGFRTLTLDDAKAVVKRFKKKQENKRVDGLILALTTQ